MNGVGSMQLGVKEAPVDLNGIKKQPNYTFAKEALFNAIGAVALAILAAFVFVHSPLPVPLGSVYSVCLIGACLSFCLSMAIKAKIAYGENRAKAEYEFAMSNKISNAEEYKKWLIKAANKGCYLKARLELAETTQDEGMKTLQINILTLEGNFKTLTTDEKNRVRQLAAELKARGKKLWIEDEVL